MKTFAMMTVLGVIEGDLGPLPGRPDDEGVGFTLVVKRHAAGQRAPESGETRHLIAITNRKLLQAVECRLTPGTLVMVWGFYRERTVGRDKERRVLREIVVSELHGALQVMRPAVLYPGIGREAGVERREGIGG